MATYIKPVQSYHVSPVVSYHVSLIVSYCIILYQPACRLAERVSFLRTAVMATVVMCRVRNPACTSASALGKERYINGLGASDAMQMAHYKLTIIIILCMFLDFME